MDSNSGSKTILSSRIFQIFIILVVIFAFGGYNLYTNKEIQEDIRVNINELLNPTDPKDFQPTTRTESDSATNDICVTNYDKIIQLVESFESSVKLRDAKLVLSLFSPSETTEERTSYDLLIRNDVSVSSPRLFSDENFDYSLNELIVTDNPVSSGPRRCIIKISENRLLNRKSESLDYQIDLEVIRNNNTWFIHKYSYQNTQSTVPAKYSAFYLYL